MKDSTAPLPFSTRTPTSSVRPPGCPCSWALEVCVKLTTEAFGIDVYEPGDIFYMNDPYLKGTRLNDATIFGPIFDNDELVGFAATRAHWLDVGGKDWRDYGLNRLIKSPVRWTDQVVSRYEPREDLIDLSAGTAASATR